MTKRNKFTPGPWHICDDDEEALIRSAVTGHPVADYFDTDDADIIAAAPELYEALKGLMRTTEPLAHQKARIPDPNCPWCDAYTALAKARGEQQETR